MIKEGLKPCPFCGAVKGFTIGRDYPEKPHTPLVVYFVKCGFCGCFGSIYFNNTWCEDEQMAIQAWNSRVQNGGK